MQVRTLEPQLVPTLLTRLDVVLGVKLSNGQWEARDLIPPHNGSNPREMQSVRDAHPGEPEVTVRDRVLGAIAVTRGQYCYFCLWHHQSHLLPDFI